MIVQYDDRRPIEIIRSSGSILRIQYNSVLRTLLLLSILPFRVSNTSFVNIWYFEVYLIFPARMDIQTYLEISRTLMLLDQA